MDREIESKTSDIHEAMSPGQVRKFLKELAEALSNASGNGNPSAKIDASVYGYDPKFIGSYHPGLDGQSTPHFKESGSGHTSFDESGSTRSDNEGINWANTRRVGPRSNGDPINWASLDGGSNNSDLF